MLKINTKKIEKQVSWNRDWRKYSKETLCESLSKIDWNDVYENVQDCWNMFESCVDELIPLKEFVNNSVKVKPNAIMKNKMNLCRRLLSKFKHLPTPELKLRIKSLSIEIKKHFYSLKIYNVRRTIL